MAATAPNQRRQYRTRLKTPARRAGGTTPTTAVILAEHCPDRGGACTVSGATPGGRHIIGQLPMARHIQSQIICSGFIGIPAFGVGSVG